MYYVITNYSYLIYIIDCNEIYETRTSKKNGKVRLHFVVSITSPSPLCRSATPILLFDGIYDCQSLEQLFNAAGTLPKRPYIVSTLCSGSTRGIPLHQLMFRHNIRVVTCSPQAEPIYGILSRTLRKQVYRLKADPRYIIIL